GVDRRAGAALRLLPERHDDPGRRSSGDHEEPDRGPDQDRDERPPLPVRNLPTHPHRHPAGGQGDGERRCVMTGLIPEKEFSRKSFVKGGGAVVVGFSLLGAAAAGKASAASIDSWLVVHADNTITAKLGKEELGQGSATGLLTIIAEELDVSMSQMRFQ